MKLLKTCKLGLDFAVSVAQCSHPVSLSPMHECFYAHIHTHAHTVSGLLWSKQFYHYDLKKRCSDGGTSSEKITGRNSSENWSHLVNEGIISMPDKWEYPGV